MNLKLLSAALVFISGLTCLAQAPAQTNAQPERYLFVVDVSAPMRDRAGATLKAVTNLLASGLEGQLHEGDELGMWTFNDQLHTGEFRLIPWREDKRDAIVRRFSAFLENRKYSGETRFSPTLTETLRVVAESKRITILMFSDGDEAFERMPFDEAINTYFLNNAEAMKRDRVPFITVLRGWHGRLIGHSITFPPWPVELPEFPPEPEPEPVSQTQTNKPAPTPKPVKQKVVIGEPLIVSGKKTAEPVARPEESPATSPATSAPPVIQAKAAVRTNPPAFTNLPPDREPAGPATPAVVSSNVVAKPGSAPTGTTPSASGEAGVWTTTILAVVGGGIVLLLALVGMWMSRRSRRTSHTSLITRSMDRDQDKSG